MFLTLLFGSLTTIISMTIQVAAVVFMIRHLIKIRAEQSWATGNTFTFDALVLIAALLVLFFGHLLQIAIWATLFVQLNEFDHFQIAFYHSAVNFTSLGYGDIVMSERWRLLGALEAANGVLMFGLSAAVLFWTMGHLFRRHKSIDEQSNGDS